MSIRPSYGGVCLWPPDWAYWVPALGATATVGRQAPRGNMLLAICGELQGTNTYMATSFISNPSLLGLAVILATPPSTSSAAHPVHNVVIGVGHVASSYQLCFDWPGQLFGLSVLNGWLGAHNPSIAWLKT
ncbi:hypothetical protein N7466_010697 [Penicillium verhagenii]|uniref:uncharacterized protein n=1 Tax=Penicillium verhagenii TaxID=1562060 RepID=UPI0025457A85|nr:uncharacterized protein N7466_010697 [Penicillium verhagenii]KAJ5917143.1 hypothetical protein N7466_010697 [Penicillium verhagenii]